MQYSKTSKRFIFCILNVKNHMHNYRIFYSYKNILKTNPDSLPATAIKISMKYKNGLFIKKILVVGKDDATIHRTVRVK